MFGVTLSSVDVWTTPNLWPFGKWVVKLSITVETLLYLIIAAAVVWLWAGFINMTANTRILKTKHEIDSAT